jgi:hypothetical protein
MKKCRQILEQRAKINQELMQANPSKDNTRQVILRLLESKMPKNTTGITMISNAGAGPNAFQFEKSVADRYPNSRLTSIEYSLKKIAETVEVVDYLNDKYRGSFFQILYGNNGNLDRIKELNLELGWNLFWADSVSRFGQQNINWIKQLKKSLEKERWASKLSSPRLVCLTLALRGQGPTSPYHLLKRALKKYGKWVKNATGTDLAQNVVQGVHAYFNSILASAKVHLEPLHAELYRGEESQTQMVLMVWELKRGKFQGQMFDRIVNRIHEHFLKTGYTYFVREKAVRKSKSKKTLEKYDYETISALLNTGLKGYGLQFKKRKNLLTSRWTHDYTGGEFANQCLSVHEREAPCLI